jgi:hypothetical protein
MILAALKAARGSDEHGCDRKDAEKENEDDGITIHQLCALPRCPPMLLRLALSPAYNLVFRVEGSVHSLDQQGMLPIHHAVQSAPVNYNFVPDYLGTEHRTSLVEILLKQYPQSVRILDNHGRLPLHYALESGLMNESDLLRMVELYPDSLRIQDPVSGLYPFMLVASRAKRQTAITTADPVPNMLSTTSSSTTTETTTNCQSSSSTSTNGDRSTDEDHTESYLDWKKDHVRMSYLLLSLCPEAIQYQGQANAATQSNGAIAIANSSPACRQECSY